MNEKIEGMTYQDFLIGMKQAQHNQDNPNHRCECKSIVEMIMKHFEMHGEDKK
jgi:hypothetical protein